MTEHDLMRTDITPFPKSPTHSALDMLFRAYMHTAHHRGQVVTYLRVKGLVAYLEVRAARVRLACGSTWRARACRQT